MITPHPRLKVNVAKQLARSKPLPVAGPSSKWTIGTATSSSISLPHRPVVDLQATLGQDFFAKLKHWLRKADSVEKDRQ